MRREKVFSGTMDRLFSHAERFAAGGIAALVFDYRGFGESGGEPRQVVDVDPDRVALWGDSLGGAHVISVAADDPGGRGRMIGKPGQVAVVSTTEAQRHLTTLAGEAGTTRWRNQVAPRGLLQMMRYRPARDAARLRAPLLVCVAVDDTETPEAMTRELADRAPHGTLRRYPGTHFDFYSDPSVRDRALADQLGFLHEHLHTSPRAA